MIACRRISATIHEEGEGYYASTTARGQRLRQHERPTAQRQIAAATVPFRRRPLGRRPHGDISPALRAIPAVLLVLGAIGIYSLTRQAADHPEAGATPSATSLRHSPPEWVASGPAWVQRIVFAPVTPAKAYTCGVPAASNTIALGASTDWGHSWQTFGTPATGAACDLIVSLTDPRDVVLTATTCLACSPPQPLHVYRSLDGGYAWTEWQLPPSGRKGRTSSRLTSVILGSANVG